MIRSIDSVAVVAVSVVSLALVACSPDGDERDEAPWWKDVATEEEPPDAGPPDVEEPALPDVGPGDATDAGDGASDVAPDVREPDVVPDTTCEDSDDDGLTDCEERERCTDPEKADTDGDGLEDDEEIELGSDPCDEDTDDDGLEDGKERRYGLDPTDSSSYDDGVEDSERWFLDACDHPSPEPVDIHEHRAGNWKVALSSAKTYTALEITGLQTLEAAAVFDDRRLKISGAILSKRARAGRTSPVDFLSDVESGGLAQVATVDTGSISSEFRTHYSKPTAVAEFDVSVPDRASVRGLRNELLFALAPFSESEVTTEMPDESGEQFEQFRVRIHAKYRGHVSGAKTFLTEFAVIPLGELQKSDLRRPWFENSASPYNIHDMEARVRERCFVWPIQKSEDVPMELSKQLIPQSLRLFYEEEWIPPSREDGWAFEDVSEHVVFFGDEYDPQRRIKEAGHPVWVERNYKYLRVESLGCTEMNDREDVNTCEPHY